VDVLICYAAAITDPSGRVRAFHLMLVCSIVRARS
jgi:hypothetical protein